LYSIITEKVAERKHGAGEVEAGELNPLAPLTLTTELQAFIFPEKKYEMHLRLA